MVRNSRCYIIVDVRGASAEPLSYIYLDEQGVESLYAQTVDRFEVERSTTIEKAMVGRAGAAARLKNLLLKALGGPEVELSGEVSGSRRRTEQSRHAYTVEQKLADLTKALQRIGQAVLFLDLSEAARHIGRGGTRAYVRVEDQFNAPQFYFGDGTASVNESGYLILEKGGPDDYEYGDDYYKRSDLRVTLSASVSKMRMSAGRMAATGHMAVFLRGFKGRRIPMGIFGIMSATPDYFQIKPYAIWR
jgi:hypothetical protein